MATKSNEYLGKMVVEIEYTTDGDGDVWVKLGKIVSLSMTTENIEYIRLDRGVYSAPDSGAYDAILDEPLSRRPNRQRR